MSCDSECCQVYAEHACFHRVMLNIVCLTSERQDSEANKVRSTRRAGLLREPFLERNGGAAILFESGGPQRAHPASRRVAGSPSQILFSFPLVFWLVGSPNTYDSTSTPTGFPLQLLTPYLTFLGNDVNPRQKRCGRRGYVNSYRVLFGPPYRFKRGTEF